MQQMNDAENGHGPVKRLMYDGGVEVKIPAALDMNDLYQRLNAVPGTKRYKPDRVALVLDLFFSHVMWGSINDSGEWLPLSNTYLYRRVRHPQRLMLFLESEGIVEVKRNKKGTKSYRAKTGEVQGRSTLYRLLPPFCDDFVLWTLTDKDAIRIEEANRDASETRISEANAYHDLVMRRAPHLLSQRGDRHSMQPTTRKKNDEVRKLGHYYVGHPEDTTEQGASDMQEPPMTPENSPTSPLRGQSAKTGSTASSSGPTIYTDEDEWFDAVLNGRDTDAVFRPPEKSQTEWDAYFEELFGA